MRLTRLSLLTLCLSSACAQGTEAPVREDERLDDAATPVVEGEKDVRDGAALDDAFVEPGQTELDAGGQPSVMKDAGPDGRGDASAANDSAVLASDSAVGAADARVVDPVVDAARPTAPPDAGVQTGFSYTPSNVAVNDLDFASAPSATLSCGTTQIDTSGSVSFSNWCGTAPKPIIKTQNSGPELVVIPLNGLTISGGQTLRIIGNRPIAFVVRGTATIAGTIDASARDNTAGAGGNWMCNASGGGNGNGNSGLNGSGGGGGGFGTAGGQGGESGNAERGRAGVVRGSAELTPLFGGCQGGRGGGCEGNTGAGGGAVQISSSGLLKLSGSVLVNGGAGAIGCGNDSGGTGGGSGGALLLEGDVVDATGSTRRATGGQGGAGQGGGNAEGVGGGNPSQAGANGRNGGANGGGGGGGGYGRIRLRGARMCTGC